MCAVLNIRWLKGGGQLSDVWLCAPAACLLPPAAAPPSAAVAAAAATTRLHLLCWLELLVLRLSSCLCTAVGERWQRLRCQCCWACGPGLQKTNNIGATGAQTVGQELPRVVQQHGRCRLSPVDRCAHTGMPATVCTVFWPIGCKREDRSHVGKCTPYLEGS
jgi:hypothetical protein